MVKTEGELFREFIESKGLSDTETGNQLKVSSEQVSKYYETKRFQKPTLFRIQSIFKDFTVFRQQISVTPKRKFIITEHNKRFAAFREKLKMSQDQLAAELGMVQTTIWRYETGALQPTPRIVNKLKDKFGMSIDWYYDGIGKPFDKHEHKNTLLKDIGTLETKCNYLEKRVVTLEATVLKLVKEFYAEKHNV